MFRLSADSTARIALPGLALVAGGWFLIIIMFLILESWPVIGNTELLSIMATDTNWFPSERQFGMVSMSLASLLVALGAVALALPFGIAMAVFQRYVAPVWLRQCIGVLTNVAVGLPSVVLGLWGLTRLVPLLAERWPPGTSMLTAIVILALMIAPTIVMTSSAALASLPPDIVDSAAALGLARHTQIRSVFLPAAWRGIFVGVLLATVRALGETMAVLMVAGNIVQVPSSLFDPVRTLTANIALEMAYATDVHRASLYASGLLLTLLVAATVLLAMSFSRRVSHG